MTIKSEYFEADPLCGLRNYPYLGVDRDNTTADGSPVIVLFTGKHSGVLLTGSAAGQIYNCGWEEDFDAMARGSYVTLYQR